MGGDRVRAAQPTRAGARARVGPSHENAPTPETSYENTPTPETSHEGAPTPENPLGEEHSLIRDGQARTALEPLAEHERPAALLVAVAVAAVLAAGVFASTVTVHDLSRHGGSLPGGIFLAGVLLALAQGMYRRRYWAVLGFEALIAFQIIVTSLALVVAETLLAAGLCALSILLSGWLFWKLVRVMGRIQAQGRR
jgi:hypothetical protein